MTFQFGAAYAPRCCPFPVSSTVAVVNASLAQRIGHYTASAPTQQPHQTPGVCGVVLQRTTPHPLVPRGLSPPGAKRNRCKPCIASWGLPRPARGEGRGEG